MAKSTSTSGFGKSRLKNCLWCVKYYRFKKQESGDRNVLSKRHFTVYLLTRVTGKKQLEEAIERSQGNGMMVGVEEITLLGKDILIDRRLLK